jgi:hypothetical protein
MRNIRTKLAAGLVALSPMAAFAAAPDVTSVTGAITDAATACATVGVAFLAFHYGVKVYRWIRKAA